MTKKPPPLCGACGRDPKKVNSEWSECSLCDCPHRRSAWSERPATRNSDAGYIAPTIQTHFDDPTKD